MVVGRGVLVACLFMSQQVLAQTTRWASPSPCVGDSTEAHTRRGTAVAVPKLDSMSAVRARATLAKLALRIDVRTVRMDGPVGVVIGQSPESGTVASSGDVVIVCLRRSPVFPSVVGLSYDAAHKTLVDAGYEAVKISSFVDAVSRVGTVVRQQPAAGSAAPHGSVDTIVVGIAPPITSVVRSPPTQQQLTTPTSRASSQAVAQAGAPNQAVAAEVSEPTDLSWLWIGGAAGVLLVGFVIAARAKDRRRLDAMRVTPYQDPGRREVTLTRTETRSPQ